MIVYGDQTVQTTLAGFAQRLANRIASRRHNHSLDEARAILAMCGQLEQGAEDAGHPAAGKCASLTDTAAARFLRACSHLPDDCLEPPSTFRVQLDELVGWSGVASDITVRSPEGFAFYGLYPEGYAQSASTWAARQDRGMRVLVAGIRSIGTALSAVVAKRLEALGFRVQRATFRPSGDPYSRTLDTLEVSAFADAAIVVDEGPGRSGSSMAAVADALVRAGYSRHAITFFAGHRNGPGQSGTPEARAWWTPDRVFATPLDEIHLGAMFLRQALEHEAARLLAAPLSGPLLDIGAGGWRGLPESTDGSDVFAAPALERPKLLATAETGARALLKFAGFASDRSAHGPGLMTLAEKQFSTLQKLAGQALTLAPLGHAHGWLITPWIEGERLTIADLSPLIMDRLARQTREAAGPPLSPNDAAAAVRRLGDMLIVNARGLLGLVDETDLHGIVELEAALAARAGLPAYGDGRLAPHEWVRTPGGAIFKTDAEGHTDDHTIIGLQSIDWDIAGAICEWGMDDDAAGALLDRLGYAVPARTIAFHAAAYAAFRGGLATMCLASAARSDPDWSMYERARAATCNRLARELSRLGLSAH